MKMPNKNGVLDIVEHMVRTRNKHGKPCDGINISSATLKVIYHPLYSLNNFCDKYIKVATRWGTSVSLYGVMAIM